MFGHLIEYVESCRMTKPEQRGRPTMPRRKRKGTIIYLRVDDNRKRSYRVAATESEQTLSVWMLDACDEFLLRHLAVNR